jgi:hypothetical protein
MRSAARAVLILAVGLAVVAGCTGPGSSGNAGSAAPPAATPAPASVAPSTGY